MQQIDPQNERMTVEVEAQDASLTVDEWLDRVAVVLVESISKAAVDAFIETGVRP